MPITLSTKDNGYLQGYGKFKDSDGFGKSAWLTSLRDKGLERFAELGFPTQQNEDWRFTNITPIARTDFTLAEKSNGTVDSGTVQNYSIPGLDCTRLVFINGIYSQELSSFTTHPENVKVLSLSEAIGNNEEIIEEHLGRYAGIENEAFTALNTAFMTDGGVIVIPGNTALDTPVHLLYISTGSDSPTLTNPRNLIIAGDNCQGAVIEHYISAGDSVHLSNAVTELVVGENSTISHYMIENEGRKSFNISTLRVQQSRHSNIRSHSVLLGGALVRNNVHPVLAGEGCDSLINGLFMSTARQHMDNFMRVEHASPHCDSTQFYNGVLDGRSRGVFHGRIIVHKDAQKTDAKQTNRNLLLSDTAQIDTKPQLEIYADDVKCTHGATIGQMDENAVFYLRSRGIGAEAARDIILNAFTNETLQSMTIEPVREYCHALVTDWFLKRKEALSQG